MQHRHIAPAEVEALPAHGMAAMATLPQQDGPAPMQPPGQQQLHGKGPRLLHQGIGLQVGRQGAGQGIEKAHIRQALQLATTSLGGTPDQLEAPASQGQHRKGALRSKQLPGLVFAAAPQLHLGGQTILAIGVLPHADAQGLAAGGEGAVGSHQQIPTGLLLAGGGCGGGAAEPQGHRRIGGESIVQHFHQRPMGGDPAHCPTGGPIGGAIGGVTAPGGQIGAAKTHLASDRQIRELQVGEGHHHRPQLGPEPQADQQQLAGMGEGVAPGGLQQLAAIEGVHQGYPPAGIGQGQGSQGPGGASPVDAGPQVRRAGGRRDQGGDGGISSPPAVAGLHNKKPQQFCCGPGAQGRSGAQGDGELGAKRLSRCPADRG